MAKKQAKAKQADNRARKPMKEEKEERASEAANASEPRKDVPQDEPKKLDLGAPAVKKAIEEGQAVLKDGKTKADAAWAIYGRLKDEDKDLIIAAFVKGATLTEKGALTYWYNCKRRAAKETASAAK